MTKLKVCEQLLLIIQLVHSKKDHDLILCELGLNSDWYASTKAAFYELPDTLFATTGLKKNDRCFNAIFKSNIPHSWLSTHLSELGEFSFTF